MSDEAKRDAMDVVREHVAGSRLGGADEALAALSEVEAQLAAYREALEDACRKACSLCAEGPFARAGRMNPGERWHDAGQSQLRCRAPVLSAVLATNAGKALLERVRHMEMCDSEMFAAAKDMAQRMEKRAEKAEADVARLTENLTLRSEILRRAEAERDEARRQAEESEQDVDNARREMRAADAERNEALAERDALRLTLEKMKAGMSHE